MSFLNWLRGDTTRSADDHAISSGYSFFFGATSSGNGTQRDANDRRLQLRADFG